MSNTAEHYIGTELELFAQARHWKSYFADLIRPHLGADVLEVGAGLGGTTALLAQGRAGRWVCLEPDDKLAAAIRVGIERGEIPNICEVRSETLAALTADRQFDTILYIDVLEHIQDDTGELLLASQRLRPGGKLIVLAPAHQWLYSPFDRAIGHFRRYTRASLSRVVPSGLELVSLKYLDSVGLLASAGNRFISRSSAPTPAQVRLWDGVMVRLSRYIDPYLAHSLGKSVLGVWSKPIQRAL